MTAPVAVHVRFKCLPGKRDQLINLLRPVVETARSDEGTQAFFVASPAEDVDGTDLLLFELYANKDAFDSHRAWLALEKLSAEGKELMSELPLAKRTVPFGNSFVRSGIAPDVSDEGLTIMAHITYAEGTDSEQIQSKLSDLINYCKENEPQTLAYHFSVDEADPSSIYIFEQFQSLKFCTETHMRTDIFAKSTGFQAAGQKTEPVFAKRVVGFSSK